MKAFYSHAGIEIYLGDCREILPTLPRVDLVLTDPPYPRLKGGLSITLTTGVAPRTLIGKTVSTPWGDDLTGVSIASRLATKGAFIFCSYHAVDEIPTLMDMERAALVTWHKRNSMPPLNNVPRFQTEFIWAFRRGTGLDWRQLRTYYDVLGLQAGCMATERICDDGVSVHPTQKPIVLIKALLAVGGETVLDPYCGTGTTLRAAKELGKQAIGIEICERYAEIAAKRLSQEVLCFDGKAQP